jgi:hypothetical protein
MTSPRAGYEDAIVEIKVWVDNWQMQWCGEHFAVGDEVCWKLRGQDSEWLATILGADLAHGVDEAEERHDAVGEADTLGKPRPDRTPVRHTSGGPAARA